MNLDLKLRKKEATGPVTAAPLASGLVVGGMPTVSLLPIELRSAVRERAVKQVLAFSVLTAVLVAGAGIGLAVVVDANSQDQLQRAQAVSQDLARQIGKFQDVQRVQQGLTLGNAAVKVGTSTEVDWQAQIDAIEQDMPAGYRVTGITADSATPFADYPQGTTPVEKPRVASVQLTATTQSITQLPVWLRKLRSIPAYADAEPSVSYDTDSGYTVQLTVHLSPKAIVAKAAQGGTP